MKMNKLILLQLKSQIRLFLKIASFTPKGVYFHEVLNRYYFLSARAVRANVCYIPH
jgi:hypothetical protein